MALHLEVLVEEPSAERALKELLPKILDGHSFNVHDLGNKKALMKKLLPRLRAYAGRFRNDPDGCGHWRILILVDRDHDDCVLLKNQLVEFARQAGIQDRVLVRIVVEELEAWFFGDIGALRAVYPRLPETLPVHAGFRDPDAIAGGTWEALDRVLRQNGYTKGLMKGQNAEDVAVHMVPERNTSRSFQAFLQGVLRLMASA